MAANSTSIDETVPFMWLDYLVFCAMLLISIVTGLYHAFAGKGQKTTSKFLLAERSMSSLPITVSVLASYLSAISILALPAEIFLHGINYWFFVIGAFITFPIAAWVYMPVYYDLGLTSAYEYLHLRFNMAVRVCGAAVFILQTTLYLAVVLYAPALALQAVTNFPLWGMIVVTGVVCTTYTALGGIKAVIWTDVFQYSVLFGSIISVLVLGIREAGGVSYIWNYNLEKGHLDVNWNPDPTERVSFWSSVIGGGINALPVFVASQVSVQRFLTARSLKESQKSIFYCVPWKLLMATLMATHGLILFAFYNNLMMPLSPAINQTDTNLTSNGPKPHYTPNYDSNDQILIYFVNREFGRIPGVQGLFVACLYAGCMSTMASGLNSLAAVVLADIIRPWRTRNLPADSANLLPGDEDIKEVIWSKTLTVVFGVISVLLGMLASKMGSLVRMTQTVFGGTGGPILGLFSLGILCKRSTSRGVLVGVAAGFAIAVWITVGAMIYKDDEGEIPDNVLWVYRISFFWYTAVFCGVTMLVGFIASEIDRRVMPEVAAVEVDPSLLATCLRPKGWSRMQEEPADIDMHVLMKDAADMAHDDKPAGKAD